MIRPTRRKSVLEETPPDVPGGIVVCVESLKSIYLTGENQPRRRVVCVIKCGIPFRSEGSDSGYPPRNLYERYLSPLQVECFSLSFVQYGTRVYPFASRLAHLTRSHGSQQNLSKTEIYIQIHERSLQIG
ncbi:MAG: hypothetical protein J07HQX50_00919 [Haloquadratum sp. J07HQX50]|nr:MAG: hypothetical protein J07HQX50_00919 [Haloquadratum sp. J07HQX50]